MLLFPETMVAALVIHMCQETLVLDVLTTAQTTSAVNMFPKSFVQYFPNNWLKECLKTLFLQVMGFFYI